jgi:hypothetical protein
MLVTTKCYALIAQDISAQGNAWQCPMLICKGLSGLTICYRIYPNIYLGTIILDEQNGYNPTMQLIFLGLVYCSTIQFLTLFIPTFSLPELIGDYSLQTNLS